jgi:hypothetical protein
MFNPVKLQSEYLTAEKSKVAYCLDVPSSGSIPIATIKTKHSHDAGPRPNFPHSPPHNHSPATLHHTPTIAPPASLALSHPLFVADFHILANAQRLDTELDDPMDALLHTLLHQLCAHLHKLARELAGER